MLPACLNNVRQAGAEGVLDHDLGIPGGDARWLLPAGETEAGENVLCHRCLEDLHARLRWAPQRRAPWHWDPDGGRCQADVADEQLQAKLNRIYASLREKLNEFTREWLKNDQLRWLKNRGESRNKPCRKVPRR